MKYICPYYDEKLKTAPCENALLMIRMIADWPFDCAELEIIIDILTKKLMKMRKEKTFATCRGEDEKCSST